ncbi:MAG TPA: hypothetical protein V6C72_07180 [Chroococcales cyanobacterium]
MDANQACRAMHMELPALEECLDSLVESGILVKDSDNRFRYAPKNGALADSIDESARMYGERRPAVINFIYSAPMRNFSDSFKLRWDKED